MNTINIVKSVAAAAVSFGVGTVIKNAVSATTPDNLKTIHKVGVVIGGLAVSYAVSDLASKYTEGTIDKVVNAFKNANPSSEPTAQN